MNHSITLSGLTLGATYHYRVTSADGASNSSTKPVPPDSLSFTMPSAPCNLTASATTQGDILCNGGTTSVIVSASGGTVPYNGTGTFTAGSGTHDYTVTDKNGCSSTATITISEPTPVIVSASPGTIACHGGSTSVVVSATGGTGAYSGTGTFSNVTAGTYTYPVTDANNCAASTTITVQQPATLIAGAVPTAPIACNGGTTSVTVSASGGTLPYTGTGTVSNQSAGSHTYPVSDANGCTNSATITLSEPTKLIVSAGVVNPILCNGGTTSVSVSATGGTSPYNGTGTIANQSAGNHTYTVTDANGCTNSAAITINEPTAITVTASVVSPILCNGGTTSVTVSATGGTGPYTGTGTFTNQTGGSHTYTVTDANGCTKSTTITINQPSAITVTATVVSPIQCKGGTTSVTVSATGGTPGYTGTGTFANQTAGTHTYTVTDANGCSNSTTITIAAGTGTVPKKPGAISGPTFNICGSGTFTYSISAVTGATSYVWTVPAGVSIVSNSGTSIAVRNVSFGTSGTISVAASNSCGASAERTLTIFAVAPDPANISGFTSVSPNQSKVRYSVTDRSGITFNWTVPTGARITSGQGTSSIRVTFGTTSGNVSVFLSNACGKTATSSLFVTVGGALAAQNFKTALSENLYLKVYPNPAASIATVAFNARSDIKYEIVVTDLVGKAILKTSSVTVAGENTVQLNMSKYSAGTYLVTLITAEGTKTVKLYKE
jgi:hypothetical protein